ncbi:hypothetical protein [Coxiella burnetii]|uniref:Uncharacterized protein n=2 Tax=Coxiella burnetii TaxID=777 RepID=A9KE42_COXBN|nr:hypothetical protein [Coxiella burnetii]ABS77508.1 hypothetical protein CBUD_1198 [Coxiella burnetii Dugway 5J108-111]AIT63236.1 hypothetical protein CBNA_0947 [Coxiella burnetii str. Namibia]ATN85830.1 hypothetical protein AYO29_04860 [Coxiella burnetii str. Schperling]EDR35753.1 hypothetical protein COXBURSA334_1122 [Coxiella burnetii Q321]OYK80134.1 hypothetical protein CbuD7E6568_06130 [Coxiella burnetii]
MSNLNNDDSFPLELVLILLGGALFCVGMIGLLTCCRQFFCLANHGEGERPRRRWGLEYPQHIEREEGEKEEEEYQEQQKGIR